MKRSELLLAIKVATEIIRQDGVLVIGSQSILGSFHEDQLPPAATTSVEVDIAPLRDDEQESLATLSDGQAGEWSEFHSTHGFYIQGVSVNTAYLPEGWASRLVQVSSGPAQGSIGFCLEPHDLCAAKLARNDDKDREFVSALAKARLVDPKVVLKRLSAIEDVRFSFQQKQVSLGFAEALADRHT